MKLISIGRAAENVIYIDDETVSRRHAELLISQSGEYYLSDCASTSGTLLLTSEGWVAVRQCFVRPEDTIKIGQVETTIQHLLSLQ